MAEGGAFNAFVLGSNLVDAVEDSSSDSYVKKFQENALDDYLEVDNDDDDERADHLQPNHFPISEAHLFDSCPPISKWIRSHFYPAPPPKVKPQRSGPPRVIGLPKDVVVAAADFKKSPPQPPVQKAVVQDSVTKTLQFSPIKAEAKEKSSKIQQQGARASSSVLAFSQASPERQASTVLPIAPVVPVLPVLSSVFVIQNPSSLSLQSSLSILSMIQELTMRFYSMKAVVVYL